MNVGRGRNFIFLQSFIPRSRGLGGLGPLLLLVIYLPSSSTVSMSPVRVPGLRALWSLLPGDIPEAQTPNRNRISTQCLASQFGFGWLRGGCCYLGPIIKIPPPSPKGVTTSSFDLALSSSPISTPNRRKNLKAKALSAMRVLGMPPEVCNAKLCQ